MPTGEYRINEDGTYEYQCHGCWNWLRVNDDGSAFCSSCRYQFSGLDRVKRCTDVSALPPLLPGRLLCRDHGIDRRSVLLVAGRRS